MTGAVPLDLFAVLGLPQRYAVDAGDLERRFHERSRVLHPDRWARAAPAERRAALERTVRLNQAYRTLRDPWARAEHLLALLGAAGSAGEPAPAFLEEQLALREELAAARAHRDAGAVRASARRVRAALAELAVELAGLLSADRPPAAALARARQLLDRARFHRSLLADADAAADARGLP